MMERLLDVETTEYGTIRLLAAGRATKKALTLGVVAVIATLLVGLMFTARPAHADTTFTVNSTADTGDTTPDGTCNTCTLREAIQEANAISGADTINFGIPGGGVKTISPNSELPEITDRVTIDGYTQPGASPNTLAVGNDANLLIELNGANTVNSLGLFISASDSVVRGLVINRFDLTGIAIGGARNEIKGNFVGTDVSGTLDLGNGWEGVFINGDYHTVGGTSPAARNLISGNDDDGVELLQAAGSEIQGNYIGTDASRTQDLGTDGVTANDLGTPPDADTGPNNLQNFPEITSATKKRKRTLIEGYLISTPNMVFTLQFFSNTLNDPDEGKTFIGQLTNVQTDENGVALFSIRAARKKAPVGLSAITATATNNSTGDTSEFSAPKKVR